MFVIFLHLPRTSRNEKTSVDVWKDEDRKKTPRTSKVEKAFSMSIPCSFPLIQHATIPPLPLLWMLKLLLQSQAWTSAMLLLKMMITIAFSLYRKSWKDRRLLASITSRIVGRQYLLVKKVRDNTCVPNRDYYLSRHPFDLKNCNYLPHFENT